MKISAAYSTDRMCIIGKPKLRHFIEIVVENSKEDKIPLFIGRGLQEYIKDKEEQMELKFKVGDRVKINKGWIRCQGGIPHTEEVGEIQTIIHILIRDDPAPYLLENHWYSEDSLELAEANIRYKEGDIVLVEAKITKMNEEYTRPYEVVTVGSKPIRAWIGRDSIKQLVTRLPSLKEPEIIYGYKVVREDEDGLYHSAIKYGDSLLSVQYSLYDKSVPNEGCNPYLFAFDSYEDTAKFALKIYNSPLSGILSVKGKILYSVLCICPDESRLLSGLDYLPKGTRLCKWILPIEEVTEAKEV